MSSNRRTIAVIGGALAGPAAAARARELDEHARIVLIERNHHVSYGVAGLAYVLSGEVESPNALAHQDADFFARQYDIEVRTRTEVQAIDADAHELQLGDGETLRYDALIYALGASSIVPDIDGLAGATNAFRFRTLGDLEGIQAELHRDDRQRPTRVAVLGGGFFGVEAVDGLLRHGGVEVTLLERRERLLPPFGRAARYAVEEALVEAGADVRTGVDVAAAERDGERITTLHLADRSQVPVDLVLITTGVRPRTELLRDAGATLRPDGSIHVGVDGTTTLPDVYACGVCVALPHVVTADPVWVPQAAEADRTAQVAGASAAGAEDVRLQRTLSTSIVRAGRRVVARTGFVPESTSESDRESVPGSDSDPNDHGFDVESVTVHAPARDVFFAESAPLTLRLIFDRESGRVLGGEVVGTEGVDRRIDVLATAVHGQMTVDELAELDLAYAPPFAPTRDAVNVAGTVAAGVRAGLATPCSIERLIEARESLIVVDVRPEGRGSEPAVAGALRIPLDALRERIDALQDRTGDVVFVSETGRASWLACRILEQRLGRPGHFLEGGLRSLRQAGVEL